MVCISYSIWGILKASWRVLGVPGGKRKLNTQSDCCLKPLQAMHCTALRETHVKRSCRMGTTWRLLCSSFLGSRLKPPNKNTGESPGKAYPCFALSAAPAQSKRRRSSESAPFQASDLAGISYHLPIYEPKSHRTVVAARSSIRPLQTLPNSFIQSVKRCKSSLPEQTQTGPDSTSRENEARHPRSPYLKVCAFVCLSSVLSARVPNVQGLG